MKSTMIRVALGAAAIAAGTFGVAGAASATPGAYGTITLPAGASTVMPLTCPSYATVMLTDTVSVMQKPGLVVNSMTYVPNADVFHRDIMYISATNTSAVQTILVASATCRA